MSETQETATLEARSDWMLVWVAVLASLVAAGTVMLLRMWKIFDFRGYLVVILVPILCGLLFGLVLDKARQRSRRLFLTAALVLFVCLAGVDGWLVHVTLEQSSLPRGSSACRMLDAFMQDCKEVLSSAGSGEEKATKISDIEMEYHRTFSLVPAELAGKAQLWSALIRKCLTEQQSGSPDTGECPDAQQIIREIAEHCKPIE
ncbi:MAG: hypothetical protein AB1646_08425 [Thermodesulfobacteriota bacterium]